MSSGIKNTYVNLEGTIEWAKLFEHNRDKVGYNGAYEDTNGRTTLNLIMDEDEYAKLQKSGSLKRGKPAGKGLMNVKFDRKWESKNDWDSGAPEVIRADGNPWNLEEDGEIGNGSKGRVQLVVTYFPGPKTYSTRIEKVKVLELVEYGNREDPFYQDESSSASEKAQPQEPQVSVEDDDMGDEIPF